MTPAQLAYEQRRAAKKGVSLEDWLKHKDHQRPAAGENAPAPIDVGLTEAEVQGAFGDEAFRVGSFLERNRCVGEVTCQSDRIAATVRDYSGKRFAVSVGFVVCGTRVIPQSTCGCTAKGGCAHSAALLLHQIRRVGRPTAAPAAAPVVSAPAPVRHLPGAVGVWLGELEACVRAAVVSTEPLPSWPGEDVGPAESPMPGTETIVYTLTAGESERGRPVPSFSAELVRIRKDGTPGSGRPIRWSALAEQAARLGLDDAHAVYDYLLAASGRSQGRPAEARPAIAGLMGAILGTGRCYWQDRSGPRLRPGSIRTGEAAWLPGPDGSQVLAIRPWSTEVHILGGAPAFYVEPLAGIVGLVDTGLAPALAAHVFDGPPVTRGQVSMVRGVFESLVPPPGATPGSPPPPPPPPLPLPHRRLVTRRVPCRPVPHVRLETERDEADAPTDALRLTFFYNSEEIDPRSARAELLGIDGNQVSVIPRDRDAEHLAIQTLRNFGLTPTEDAGRGQVFRFGGRNPGAHWAALVFDHLPALAQSGWRTTIDPEFRHRVVDGVADWSAEVAVEGEGGWFSMAVGIEVEGVTVPLLPLLVQALRSLDANPERRTLGTLIIGETAYLGLPDGRTLALPAVRVRTMINVLIELHLGAGPGGGGGGGGGGGEGGIGADGRLRLSNCQAAALAALNDTIRLRWFGAPQMAELARRVKAFAGVVAIAPPAGLTAQLRPYQSQGLAWLQFLRDFDFGGILADDMGLGKTLQTLAHILVEKEAGRLEAPCLVVCPTSLVPNWRAEAARFAPALRVVALHGPDRAGRWGELEAADLAITTYSLLVRDEAALLDREWSLVVLDEAQAIKNPAAKATLVACRLRARHRLCLTGTPVENHLGELWSAFAFLMPGLLGDTKIFQAAYRTPIEKHRDGDRLAGLRGRIKPFLLRRTKTEVATELPPKVESICRIELAPAQRDLYETLRLALHEKVRAEIERKGLARSQIMILDALLKLRQVCCDPRLVKAAAARAVKASAKLAALMEMLPELIEDGRSILLFSQFTEMLDLIKAEVADACIPFVELRGDTRDRETPVTRFQAGEVPLFLISLKAGGTGLNLTAADTVIHYDPWWNPAVERQATDRAHRIGQDKTVFVYKLITEGTIEDRILDLQERKKGLAEGLLATGSTGEMGITAGDLAQLFQAAP